jgi:hypothetical protein
VPLLNGVCAVLDCLVLLLYLHVYTLQPYCRQVAGQLTLHWQHHSRETTEDQGRDAHDGPLAIGTLNLMSRVQTDIPLQGILALMDRFLQHYFHLVRLCRDCCHIYLDLPIHKPAHFLRLLLTFFVVDCGA